MSMSTDSTGSLLAKWLNRRPNRNLLKCGIHAAMMWSSVGYGSVGELIESGEGL